MKKLLIGVVALLLVIIVVLIAAPFFIPTETYKEQIAQAARDATGRELEIKGDLRLSLLPSLELAAEDVAFANAPGAKHPQMATLDELLVQLQIFPLLSGEIAVDSFVLVEPVIRLEVDEGGRANWDFGGAPKATAKDAPGTGAAPGGQDEAAAALRELRLGDVRLEGGLVSYDDAKSGQSVELSQINMSLALPDLASPFSADGSVVWNGEKVTLEVKGENLRGLLEGVATPLDLEVDSAPIRLAYQGRVTMAAAPRVAGEVTLDVPSIRDLAAWTGSPIEAEGSGFGPLSIKGQVDVAGNSYAFKDAAIGLDEMKATGDFRAETGGARPYLKGRLDVDVLDVNPYLPPPKEGADKAPAAGDGGGKAAPAEWSDEPIDLSGLKAADLDFNLTVGGIRVQEIKVGRSALKLALKDGLLTADLAEFNLYGGAGKGKIVLDGRREVPAVEKVFAIEGVQAEPLLSDAAGFDRLAGTGRFDIAIATRGRSQRAMVEALNGRGAVTFIDGAVKGVNLAAMVRNVKTAFTAGGGNAKTDFTELSGTFDIKNGILRNDDLKMLSPLLRLAGAGSTSLPQRTVDYRLEPKVVSSLEGQGSGAESKGIAVPVLIEGKWHDLQYRPDLRGVITEVAKDPSKAVDKAKDTLKDAGKDLKDAGKDLKKLLKGKSEGGEGELPDPNKVLKNLFGN